MRPGIICGRCGVAIALPEGMTVKALKPLFLAHDKLCALGKAGKAGREGKTAPVKPLLDRAADVVRDVSKAAKMARELDDALEQLSRLFR